MRYVTSKVPFGSALESLGLQTGMGQAGCHVHHVIEKLGRWAGLARWAGWAADEKSIPPHLWKFSQAGRIYLLLLLEQQQTEKLTEQTP